ncbi:MAG: hypothetical protein V8S98_05640 [Lachnospiraceae bacterium]
MTYQCFVCSIVLILLLGNTCRFLKHVKKAMTLYLVVTKIVFVCLTILFCQVLP